MTKLKTIPKIKEEIEELKRLLNLAPDNMATAFKLARSQAQLQTSQDILNKIRELRKLGSDGLKNIYYIDAEELEREINGKNKQ